MKRLSVWLSRPKGITLFKAALAALVMIGLGILLSAPELLRLGVVLGFGVFVLVVVRFQTAPAPRGGYDHHADFRLHD